ncbi:beta strand repeat-containing protein [Burkholderia vietnamiensis]|uniref:beta strand repeat-containing protein n=1 Tax=Burkholderia vietnamiensis TaxID=60552 RepID=UPI001CF3BA4D|nr:filamentous hemagglutinin N-terminal domain-containing protein [Burkholderia vietnamiensis]MCA8179952.1 filamentous hemagglutinin N-terminal domain-containing protein [Burkholderia vietnamiensis]
MRRLMRELECRCLQREARKRAIIFDRSSQSSGGHALWVKATAWVMSVVMYLGPAVLLADEAAYAAPIVDPRAPIAFQPSVTQTSAGVPAINIPAANANGISVGQYQSFDIDSRGLVLNNSTIAGTPLLGGTLGANPNLNGRPATTIINQVTSNNIATLNGPLEVFGAPAAVIVSAPGGVSVNGMALTNVPGLTLTTGVPQFLTGVGGSATDFAHAGAVGYDVRSGNISINGPAGVNGPGAGIEGTVGNIDLIGQSVTLAAPLRADQRVNVVTGNQLVTPTASDSSGATYGSAANGVVNTAAAIGKGIAVDASQYGSVTSGTVYIVSTAAGMGVNTQGPMSATAGNVVVNANGDISVGKTFANQNVNLTSTGTTTITDTGLANRNYTVAANGDINAAGAVSAGQNVSMTAGGNLNAASVAANGAASLTAGQSMSIGSLSAHDIALQTASGDLTVGGLSAPGRVSAKAGRDLTVSGAVQGGSAVALAGARNVTVNGQVSSVGATTIAAQTGSASVNGNVTSGAALSITAGGNTSVQGTAASIGDMTLAANGGLLTTTGNVASLGALTATGQQGVNLGGTVYSGGNASIGSGAGSVTVGGAVSTPGALNINAGQDATVAGTVQSGQTATIAATRDANLNGGLSVDNAGNANVTAGRDINGTGAISVANDTTLNAGNNVGVSGAIQTGNSLNVSAGKNLSVGATTAVGNSTLSATNGSVTLAGNALAGGVTTITAGTDINTQGSVESLGDLSVSAKSGNLNASSPVSTAGNANLNAGQNLTLNGPTTVSKNASLTAANITTQNVAVGGNLTAAATSNLDTSAGQLNQPFSAIAPALSVGGNATLSGANVTTANAVVGGTTQISGTQSLTTGGTAAFKDDATLSGGTVSNVGTQMAAGNLNVSGSSVSNTGSLSSLQTATINATDITNRGTVYGPTVNVTAGNSVTNAGAVMATNALNLTTTTLSNRGGTIFAGDVQNPSAATGDVNVTVNGGAGAFDGTSGSILAHRNVTFTAPNLTFDPLAATSGTMLAGQTLTVNPLSLTNTGAWNLGTANVAGQTLVINSSNISNTGSITSAGDISLNGSTTNAGSITGRNVSTSGSLTNQKGATLHANVDAQLDGATINQGTVEAANDLHLTGTSYDNSNATTQAGHDVTANLIGALANVVGKFTAGNDMTIQAASVNNNAVSPNACSAGNSTTTIVSDPALLNAILLGSETVFTVRDYGGSGGTQTVESWPGAQGPLSDLNPNYTTGTITLLTAKDFQSDPQGAYSYYPDSGNVYVVDNAAAHQGSGLQQDTPIVLNLPTISLTVSGSQAVTNPSLMAAGHDLSITANSLANESSTITATHNVDLNVQSLDNGPAPSTALGKSVEQVNQQELDTLIAQLRKLGAVTIPGSGLFYHTSDGMALAPDNTFSVNSSVVAPSRVSTVTQAPPAPGTIAAGNNVTVSGGNLTNGGTIAGQVDVTVDAASFTNQGRSTPTLVTNAGCAAGVSDADCNHGFSTFNPNPYTSQVYTPGAPSYATVSAGRDLVIASNTTSNNLGQLVAGQDVTIGGAGTTAANATQSSSVTNTSGTIQSGRDLTIVTNALTNTIADPVKAHENYGAQSTYGCSMTGATPDCEAMVDNQSGPPSIINAGRNLGVTAGSMLNTGSVVTAGQAATINLSSANALTNQDQVLNAYWHSHSNEVINGSYVWHDNYGCTDLASCQRIWGSAWTGTNEPLSPPSPIGTIYGLIQAPTLTVQSQGNIVNSGNVIGNTIAMSGLHLVNGYTGNVYTPLGVAPTQVVSLAPLGVPAVAATAQGVAGQAATAAAQASNVGGQVSGPVQGGIQAANVGKPGSPGGASVQTIAGASSPVAYLINNPAAQVVGGIGPSYLISQLPSNLQPGSVPFYYNPFDENQALQTAALQRLGKASFIDGLAYDNTYQTTVVDQEKYALYANAVDYAKAHDLKLGVALSAEQLASLDKPMLWYVEQAVPQPGCTATGGAVCPTVDALMPQVYLPQGYNAVNPDGVINGHDVTLAFHDANRPDDITNTGSITATGTLSTPGARITNLERSVDIGSYYAQAGDDGYTRTTGTVLQQGGFMSAADFANNAAMIDNIGGQIQKIGASGSIDQAGTAAELAQLKSRLGGNFQQSTVSDHLNSEYQSDGHNGGVAMVFQAAMAVAFSYVLGPIGGALATSIMQQEIANGGVNLGALAKAVGTAYLTQFADSALNLNGFSNLGNGAVAADTTVTLTNLGNTAATIAERAVVNGAITTAINGGSYGTAMLTSAVNDVAAVANNAIGLSSTSSDSLLAKDTLGFVLAHAVVGCASGAALGQGCGGGAIGAATSAVLGSILVDQAGGVQNLRPDQIAAIVTATTLLGGLAANAAGQNGVAGANAATSEAINNATNPEDIAHGKDLIPLGGDIGTGLGGLGGGGGMQAGEVAGAAEKAIADAFGSLEKGIVDAVEGQVASVEQQFARIRNSIGNSTSSTISANNATGRAAEIDAANYVKDQPGVSVQSQVSLSSDTTRAVADIAVNGPPNGVVKLPPGFIAEDINGNALVDTGGNPITSIKLNPQGQAILEVKTGNATTTSNQGTVYPSVQSGTATGTGPGTNAGRANMSGSLPPTPVVVLRRR